MYSNYKLSSEGFDMKIIKNFMNTEYKFSQNQINLNRLKLYWNPTSMLKIELGVNLIALGV